MRLFAKAKQAPSAEESAAETRRSIAALNEHALMIEKRIEFKQKEVDKHRATAKRLVSSNSRQKALVELKRARQLETHVEQMYAQLEKITTLRDSLEGAAFQHQTIKAIQMAAGSMRDMNAQFTEASGGQNPWTVIQDATEQMNQATEISDALSQPLSSAMVFDDEELEAELAAMEQDVLDDRFDAIAEEPSRQQSPVFVQHNHHYYSAASTHADSSASAAAAAAPRVPTHRPVATAAAAAGLNQEEFDELQQLKRMKEAMLSN